MNNAEWLNSLRLNRWDREDPAQRLEDKETLARLAQCPDLEPLLRFLAKQKALATFPVDPTQANWQETALINRGRCDLITEIANQFK